MSADELRQLLRDRGAETIDHPGGTLYAHLNRVHDRLRTLGQPDDVALAGLGHAVYGTDGFTMALVTLNERDVIRAIVGADVEGQIYRYGACDRARTWRALPATHVVWDRFRDEPILMDPREAAAFGNLSVVNELDVCEQDPTTRERWSVYFNEIFTTWTGVASDAVLAAMR